MRPPDVRRHLNEVVSLDGMAGLSEGDTSKEVAVTAILEPDTGTQESD
jgi:hypothetical protein